MNLQGEAYACCNLGVLYYRQRQYDEALTYFERFFEAARALKDQHVLDVARVNLGTVRAALTFKDYLQARHCRSNYSTRLLSEMLVINRLSSAWLKCAGCRQRSANTSAVEECTDAFQGASSCHIVSELKTCHIWASLALLMMHRPINSKDQLVYSSSLLLSSSLYPECCTRVDFSRSVPCLSVFSATVLTALSAFQPLYISNCAGTQPAAKQRNKSCYVMYWLCSSNHATTFLTV